MARNGVPADEAVERAGRLDTATLSDAMDKLGIAGQCLGIKPVGTHSRFAGRAYTVRYVPVDPVNPGTVGDYIDDVPPGAVVTLDNGGRGDATVWGDILTLVASTKGVAGTVVEGACRDIALAVEIRYPLFSRSSTMRTGKDRVQVAEVGGLVNIAGVSVRAGDIICGDADGVVALPRERERAVLDIAEGIERAEAAIREAVRSGRSLAAARKEHGYHALQTKLSG